MKSFFCSFNDKAVALLSHAGVVAVWWVASAGSIAMSAVRPSETTITLALSFLALAYSSAISERQLRTEQITRERDDKLHAKIDELLIDIDEVDDTLAGSEPKMVD